MTLPEQLETLMEECIRRFRPQFKIAEYHAKAILDILSSSVEIPDNITIEPTSVGKQELHSLISQRTHLITTGDYTFVGIDVGDQTFAILSAEVSSGFSGSTMVEFKNGKQPTLPPAPLFQEKEISGRSTETHWQQEFNNTLPAGLDLDYRIELHFNDGGIKFVSAVEEEGWVIFDDRKYLVFPSGDVGDLLTSLQDDLSDYLRRGHLLEVVVVPIPANDERLSVRFQVHKTVVETSVAEQELRLKVRNLEKIVQVLRTRLNPVAGGPISDPSTT